jgi:hypothetical protein
MTGAGLVLDRWQNKSPGGISDEQELGVPDPDWPQWYAEHMARTLTEDGYRLTRLDPR